MVLNSKKTNGIKWQKNECYCMAKEQMGLNDKKTNVIRWLKTQNRIKWQKNRWY